jgi:hypothetical protein
MSRGTQAPAICACAEPGLKSRSPAADGQRAFAPLNLMAVQQAG